jgi:hypothetical protein
MDIPQQERLRTYAWNYFAYHADQRMKAFHLYIILVSGISGGIVALVARSGNQSTKYSASLCFLMTFVSIMFCLLDHRNAELVKNGEAAVQKLDELEQHQRNEGIPHVLEIFAHDDYRTSNKLLWSLNPHISYSDIFLAVFVGFATLGVASGILLLIFY